MNNKSKIKKPKAQKEWQQKNADKVREYTRRYQEGKKKITVLLSKELADQIDKIKPPEQTYGGWVREQIERLVKNQLSP